MIDLLTGSRKPAQPTGRRDVHAEGRYLMTAFGTRALLSELEATVEENLHRHLAAAEDWMPHEYVPWSQGRNFAGPAANHGLPSSQASHRPPARHWS